MAITVANPGFETVNVSTQPGAFLATGAGEDLTIGGWIFEQTAVNYADTINDFSDVQGFRDWFYGYSSNPSNPAAFSNANMIFPNPTTGAMWGGNGSLGVAHTPWLNPTMIHPPANYVQAYGVKRWRADVTGIVWIVGYCADDGGDTADGLRFTIRRNGLVLYDRTVMPGNPTPTRYAIETMVVEGDLIDFVVDTLSANIGSALIFSADAFQFRASIFSGSQSGIVHASSAFAPPIAPVGQVAMIQGTGRFYQMVTAPRSRIRVKFKACSTGPFTLQVILGFDVVDEITVNAPAMAAFQTDFFDYPIGTHRIAFQGLGDNDQFLYIDDVSIVGTFYVDGVEDSDSDETISNANRGRSQADLSSSIEVPCRTVKYIRSGTEGSESAENRNLGVLNPYDPNVNPNDGTIGTNPGVSTDVKYSDARSETSQSRESYILYFNGFRVPTDPCRLEPLGIVIAVADPSFENVFVGPVNNFGSFAPVSGAWSPGGAAFGANGNGYNAAGSPTLAGNQFLQLQTPVWTEQDLVFPGTGLFEIKFLGSHRVNDSSAFGPVNQIRVLIGGVIIGTISPTRGTWTEYTMTFTVGTIGTYTLRLQGVWSGGDVTAFVDNVRIRRLA